MDRAQRQSYDDAIDEIMRDQEEAHEEAGNAGMDGVSGGVSILTARRLERQLDALDRHLARLDYRIRDLEKRTRPAPLRQRVRKALSWLADKIDPAPEVSLPWMAMGPGDFGYDDDLGDQFGLGSLG